MPPVTLACAVPRSPRQICSLLGQFQPPACLLHTLPSLHLLLTPLHGRSGGGHPVRPHCPQLLTAGPCGFPPRGFLLITLDETSPVFRHLLWVPFLRGQKWSPGRGQSSYGIRWEPVFASSVLQPFIEHVIASGALRIRVRGHSGRWLHLCRHRSELSRGGGCRKYDRWN